MTSFQALLTDLADLHEAAGHRLRAHAAAIREEGKRSTEQPLADRVIATARRLHESIGPRQLEALRCIAEAHPHGVVTASLVKAMHYDQPNVYLTLKSLYDRNHKFLWKDSTTSPHRYFLSDTLLTEAGVDDDHQPDDDHDAQPQ